ncbi:MAG: phosphoribosylanthranilate isomerase [Chthoniobacterales bacterium]
MDVKICGIRREEDALLATSLGADAVGLLVGKRHNSADFISPELAGQIAGTLPPAVHPVLVTHIPDVDQIERFIRVSGITTVQLHSEIAPEMIRELRGRVSGLTLIKVVHIVSSQSLDYPAPFVEFVDGFVLDSINRGTNQVGGTGQIHDWSISRDIVARYRNKPIFLAGGLDPDNVQAAVEFVKPSGVDVNSGTKGHDGFKDPVRLRQFIDRAKASHRK